MTREEFMKRYAKIGTELGIIPESKGWWYNYYTAYKEQRRECRNPMEAIFIVSEKYNCSQATVYAAVSFFLNLKTNIPK